MTWLVNFIWQKFWPQSQKHIVTITTTGSRQEVIDRLTAIHEWCEANGFPLTTPLDEVIAALDADLAAQNFVLLPGWVFTNTATYEFPTKERAAMFKLFNF